MVSKQVGQWGTEYDDRYDLGTAPLQVARTSVPVEQFTISVVSSDVRRGQLVMEWGAFRWVAPIEVP